VVKKELSANAAAIQAGFRQKPTGLDRLMQAWGQATERSTAVKKKGSVLRTVKTQFMKKSLELLPFLAVTHVNEIRRQGSHRPEATRVVVLSIVSLGYTRHEANRRDQKDDETAAVQQYRSYLELLSQHPDAFGLNRQGRGYKPVLMLSSVTFALS
jgi:hypothetical protein